MRFAFIASEKAHYSLSLLCRCMRVSRSGFYAWERRPESARARQDRQLKVRIRTSFSKSKGRYGSPRIHRDLRAQQQHVSRKRVIRLMQEEGLHARRRKRFVRTTDSNHRHPVAPNLLNRDFTADGPNQRWVSDTTEFVVDDGGKLYLAVVLDLFSRMIVGWAVGPTNDRHLTMLALERALQWRRPNPGALHHSDRGSTYASDDYRRLLATYGLTCSMSRRANCHDNAVVESFFSSLKMELTDRFSTREAATPALFQHIEVFYNQQRLHSTLGYVSPATFERGRIPAA